MSFGAVFIAAAILLFLIGSAIDVLRRRIKARRWAKAPKRDVSTVAGAGAADFKQEVVRTGGAWKPNLRRLVLRDNRLLPKLPYEPPIRTWPPPPKPKYLTEAEADRLFSASLRTRNRDVMDLAADEAQLQRYGLPIWKSEADVASALGLSLGQFLYFSQHRHRETAPHYIAFAIPKRSGGERIIYAPKRRLKAALRKLDQLLVKRLPRSEHAHGFIKARSIATNARPHVGQEMVLRFDIMDCFPSIHFGRVRGLLLALGYGYPVAAALAVMMTEPPRQRVVAEGKIYHVPTGPRVCVQGAPTSPGLCNAVLLRLDRRLAGLAKKHGVNYTRYADDLTFSGPEAKVTPLLGRVPKIVAAEGFAINREKTRLMRASGRQVVAGVIVNKELGLSRQERRKLRAALHQQRSTAEAGAAPISRHLEGKLAYLHMLNPRQAQALRRGAERVD
jgi:RNA-directed DNA polymerase